MSAPPKSGRAKPRRPQAFAADDPAVRHAGDDSPWDHAKTAELPESDLQTGIGASGIDKAGIGKAGLDSDGTAGEAVQGPSYKTRRKGLRWGAILISAITSLMMLAATTWLTHFISATIAGNDWLAWASFMVLCIAVVAMLAIALREIAGIMRLHKLRKFRQQVEQVVASGDANGERRVVRRLKAIYRQRADMKWALARFHDHEQDIVDAGDLLILAERDLLRPLDLEARFAITSSAKKVSLVTAISPIAIIDVLFVLSQNLMLLRRLATLYGARPGVLGGLRLAKLVAGHIIATGGLALTDDLIGQILGHDLMRRLSRRIGEGVFNGALSARIGIAAIEILRPLPFIEARPLRLRDLVPIIFKRAEDQHKRNT